VRASSARANVAFCVAPPHSAEVVRFSFSYDANSWSTDDIRFAFVEEEAFGGLLGFSPAIVGAVAVAVTAVCCCCAAALADKKQEKEEGEGAEGVGIAPLVKDEADSADEQREPFVPKKRGHFD
jgi:hypothetical protein